MGTGKARLGTAWRGGLGTARLGGVRRGKAVEAWLGSARPGVARRGGRVVVWFGAARLALKFNLNEGKADEFQSKRSAAHH